MNELTKKKAPAAGSDLPVIDEPTSTIGQAGGGGRCGMDLLNSFASAVARIHDLRFGGDLQADGRVIVWVRIGEGKRVRRVLTSPDTSISEAIGLMVGAALAGALEQATPKKGRRL